MPRGAGRIASERAREIRLLRPPTPLFLERETYLRRRVMDAARLLPMFGAALLMVPLFWGPDHRTSAGTIYLFAVWLGLIVVAGVLSRRLAGPLRQRGPSGGDAPPGAGRRPEPQDTAAPAAGGTADGA